MITEIEYSRALNKQGWSFLARKVTPIALVSLVVALYAKHCDMHERARQNFFYNRSKLYGTAKNPQY